MTEHANPSPNPITAQTAESRARVLCAEESQCSGQRPEDGEGPIREGAEDLRAGHLAQTAESRARVLCAEESQCSGQRPEDGEGPIREGAEDLRAGHLAQTAESRARVLCAEINGIKEQVRATVVTGAIEIGRRLKEAKSLIPYGEWGAWLQTNVHYSERTAQNMMRIADEYGRTDPQALADLSLTQAVLLLGVPAEDREAFVRDNDLEDMTTRELQAAVDALKADRAKMQLTIEELMRDQEKADACRQAQQQSEARAAEAEKALEDARRQLYDAETRHAAALKAEKDKKTGAQAEKDKLAKERNEARQKLEEINRKVARLETELTEAREQVRTVETVPPSMAEELESLRRKAAQSGAETEVRTAYDVLREAYERLTARLAAMEREDPERAATYRTAFGRGLRTMAERVEAGQCSGQRPEDGEGPVREGAENPPAGHRARTAESRARVLAVEGGADG